MKKLVCLIVSGTLLLAMPVAGAAKKKKPKKPRKPVKIERVVELSYDHPSPGVAGPGAVVFGAPMTGSNIPVEKGEWYIKVEIKDDSGQMVAGKIAQGTAATFGPFCGAHKEPVKIVESTPIYGIYAFSGTCEDGTPSVMTTGTVKVTFSNLP